MGQMTTGVLYGCKCPRLKGDEDGEAAYELVSRWEKAARVTWDTTGLKVRTENEGGVSLLGVWVAVGGSGEDGAGYFVDEAMPLDQFQKVYSKHVKAAAELWARFAAHVAKHEGIKLPAPTLWLTPCEVA